MSNTITCTYTQDPALNAAADAAAFPPPNQRKWWTDRLYNGLIVLVIVVLFELALGIALTLRDWIAAFCGALVLKLFVTTAIFKAKRKASKQTEKDGATTVTLTPNGFQAGSNFGHLFVNWHSVEKVLKLEFGIGVVWDNVAFAIPQSAFPHGLTREDMLAQIDNWRNGATEL